MSSVGQWEVVGKPKKAKANGQSSKLSRSEKKKFAENAPKAEDILPAMEVKTLYTSLSPKSDENRENKPKELVKPAVNSKQAKESDAARKSTKKPLSSQNTVPDKRKVPRSMEECLKMMDVGQLAVLVETGRAQFPQDPSVWLRSLAATLNLNMPSNPWPENSAALTRSLLALCPAKLNKFLVGVVKSIETARQAFYENCLSAVANDMSKGSPVNGWLLLLETMGQVCPELAVSNIPRWTSLMKSYQNRSHIGNSLLWSLGQAGMRSLPHGIQVWESIFLPAADLKSYTRTAVDSLSQMFASAAQKSDCKESRISQEKYEATYLLILSLINLGAFSKEVASLHASFQSLAMLTVERKNIFLCLFSTIHKIPTSHPLRTQLMIQCIQSDLNVLDTWKDSYRNNLTSSASLLRHLHSQWSNYKLIMSSNKCREFLIALQSKNIEISGLRGADKEGFLECQRLVEDLLKKLTNMSGGFPWKTANFLLLVAITGLAAYDINKHGSFQSSSTGVFLRETGALHYGQKAYETTNAYCQTIYKWGEKELPPYWNQYGSPVWEVVKEQSQKAATLIKAWAINLGNWASETWPVVADFIEKYAPGLLGKCRKWSLTAWDYTKQYSELGFDYAKNTSISAVTWVNTNVLVGRLSPENLTRVSLEAYNATQAFAIDTYQWISEKVLPSTTATTKNA